MNLEILSCKYDSFDKKSFTARLKDLDKNIFEGNEFPFGVVIDSSDSSEIFTYLMSEYKEGKLKIEEVGKEENIFALENQIRCLRNSLLSETDYLVLPDYPIEASLREEVLVYRQNLRDITNQEGYPENIIWPSKPILSK